MQIGEFIVMHFEASNVRVQNLPDINLEYIM